MLATSWLREPSRASTMAEAAGQCGQDACPELGLEPQGKDLGSHRSLFCGAVRCPNILCSLDPWPWGKSLCCKSGHTTPATEGWKLWNCPFKVPLKALQHQCWMHCRGQMHFLVRPGQGFSLGQDLG